MRKVLILIAFFTVSTSFQQKKSLKLILDPSIENSEKYRDKISSAIKFSETFIAEYKNYIRENVPSDSINDYRFSFTEPNSAELKLTISSLVDEMLLEINTSSNYTLTGKLTKYPLQIFLLNGEFALLNMEAKIAVNWDSVKYDYTHQFTIMTPIDFPRISGNCNDDVKCFALHGYSSAVELYNFSFIGSHEFKYKVDLGFLTIVNSFDELSEYVKKIAQDLARIDIEGKYFKSEYFKEILAMEELAPFASQMISKYNQDILSGTNNYTFVDFKKDSEFLQRKCDSLLIRNPDYVPNLLNEQRKKSKDGVLFWGYTDFKEFSNQWTFANAGLIIVIVVLKLFSRLKQINQKFKKIFSVYAPYTVIVAINVWIFGARPLGMPFTYWIIPGFVFIIAVAFAVLYFPKEKP